MHRVIIFFIGFFVILSLNSVSISQDKYANDYNNINLKLLVKSSGALIIGSVDKRTPVELTNPSESHTTHEFCSLRIIGGLLDKSLLRDNDGCITLLTPGARMRGIGMPDFIEKSKYLVFLTMKSDYISPSSFGRKGVFEIKYHYNCAEGSLVSSLNNLYIKSVSSNGYLVFTNDLNKSMCVGDFISLVNLFNQKNGIDFSSIDSKWGFMYYKYD